MPEQDDGSAHAFSVGNNSATWEYLTADLPGIGGQIKQQPDDFCVDEIPAYPPSGEGEHLFLRIEKRNVSAGYLLEHLAQQLAIKERDIGMAGMKDRAAITRQYVSVPASCEQNIATVNSDCIEVLEQTRHRHKLKTGHLLGNRFSILLRDVTKNAEELAQQILAQLEQQGMPNYYGEQRFGQRGNSIKQGLQLLATTEAEMPRRKRQSRHLKRLALSAVQSLLFNQLLNQRINSKAHNTVQAGDVMQVCESGGLFVVEESDLSIEQQRFQQHETSITGPMFGPKMKQPTGEVLQLETTALQNMQLTVDDFKKYPKLTTGTRRPYRVFFTDLSLTTEQEGLRFNFTLPKGVYATTLLREIMKPTDV